jgi:tetratricopeptide (TPR) repeat protein
LAIREKLAAEFPDVLEYRVALGGSYCNIGNLMRDGDKPFDSLALFAKAIDCLAPVHERDPHNERACQILRNSHWGRARAHDLLERFAEAIPDWDRAIELSPKEGQPGFRIFRAISRLKAGQLENSLADVSELANNPALPAGQWYNLACVYAVASGKIADKKEEYAKRALELLQKAVKAGYLDAANMKMDKDLDPLREREDFKKLLTEVEVKTEKASETAPSPRERK